MLVIVGDFTFAVSKVQTGRGVFSEATSEGSITIKSIVLKILLDLY